MLVYKKQVVVCSDKSCPVSAAEWSKSSKKHQENSRNPDGESPSWGATWLQRLASAGCPSVILPSHKYFQHLCSGISPSESPSPHSAEMPGTILQDQLIALLRQWAFWQGTVQHTKSAFSAYHTVILGLSFASVICKHMWELLGIQKIGVKDAFESVALYLNVYVILICLWQLYINLDYKNSKKLKQHSHWKTHFKKF